ncbi:MAG: YcnI family protein [Ilumatobacteraceae bacterium]
MLVGGAAVAVAVVGAWAAPASAHVSIDTLGTVDQGSFAKLGFSVPNERADAGTVMLRVELPADHPLAYVSVQPMPGWDIETTTRALDEPLDGEGGSITEVVDTITWTATGDTEIAPGEFELFWISAGQMPTDVTELAFPAVQTYSSGEEVAWIDPATGGAEPEHPAPTVQLAAAGASGEDATAPADDDDGIDALAIVALVVGALGLVAGVSALVVARRPRPAA